MSGAHNPDIGISGLWRQMKTNGHWNDPARQWQLLGLMRKAASLDHDPLRPLATMQIIALNIVTLVLRVLDHGQCLDVVTIV